MTASAISHSLSEHMLMELIFNRVPLEGGVFRIFFIELLDKKLNYKIILLRWENNRSCFQREDQDIIS
jgi:hypothetical protein